MIYIDVRTKTEYESGHIEGAINLDLSEILSGSLPELSKDSEIITYCQSGGRSAMAKQILEQNGFTNVKDGGDIHSAQNKF